MAAAFVSSIEPHAVTDPQPVHGPRQIGFRQFHHQVEMIVHQHVGVEREPKRRDGLGQQFTEMPPIGVTEIDRWLCVRFPVPSGGANRRAARCARLCAMARS